MQKWEYLFIDTSLHEQVRKASSINGRPVPNWERGGSIEDLAQQLGDQGWELVSSNLVYPAQNVWVWNLIFKRPNG